MIYIDRTIEASIKAHLEREQITVILGPRQVGKTTLIKKIMAELQQSGHKTVLFNLDIDIDQEVFESQQKLVTALELQFGKEPAIVFIDEIQRKKDAGLFLKGVYDRMLPYKFVVTGSGSLELREKIIESLAGRKRVFQMMPLGFEEFFHYKTDYQYKDKFIQAASLYQQLTSDLLKEYMTFGGYPRVVLADTKKEKEQELQEIFQSYMDRDIASIDGVDRPDAFSKMIRILSHRIGNFINYSTLSNLSGISAPTVKKYLWYVERTFMMAFIKPFYTNPEKELKKSPASYFIDFGIANLARRSFAISPESGVGGFLFQNFVYTQLRALFSDSFAEIKTWRTKDGAEVDFVIDIGEVPIPIEVKFGDYSKSTIPASLKSFMRLYHPKFCFIINKSQETVIKYENVEIYVLPFWKINQLLERVFE